MQLLIVLAFLTVNVFLSGNALKATTLTLFQDEMSISQQKSENIFCQQSLYHHIRHQTDTTTMGAVGVGVGFASNTTTTTTTNGGLIVFWHVPKTGGSTLRARFTSRHYPRTIQNWISMGLMEPKYTRLKKQAETLFLSSNANKKVLFWEIHGGPSLNKLNKDIVRWRSLAEKHNKTFFSFTVLRDGVSAAISYFNFYCPPCNEPRIFGGVDHLKNTHESFTRAVPMWKNYQSRILFHGDYGTNWTNRSILPHESQSLYQASQLDWVGTTETLSTTTIPLLERILNEEAVGVVSNEKNATIRYQEIPVPHIAKEDLPLESIRFIREHTALDHELWERARRDYHWSSSENPDWIRRSCSNQLQV